MTKFVEFMELNADRAVLINPALVRHVRPNAPSSTKPFAEIYFDNGDVVYVQGSYDAVSADLKNA